MPVDRAVIDGFGLSAGTSQGLAVAVLERAGREDAWKTEMSGPAIHFLAALGNRLAELLWNDDRRVDVLGRARLEAQEMIYSVDRLTAPGILYAIAPWTEMPRGSIGDLHRASRPKIAEALVPLIARILRSWCEDELIIDIGKRAS